MPPLKKTMCSYRISQCLTFWNVQSFRTVCDSCKSWIIVTCGRQFIKRQTINSSYIGNDSSTVYATWNDHWDPNVCPLVYDTSWGVILSTCTWSFTNGVTGSGQKSTWFSITSGSGVEGGEVCILPVCFLGSEDRGLLSGRNSWLRSSTPGRKGRCPSWLGPSTVRLPSF